MICSKCSKLNILESKKKCVKCKGDVYFNLFVLCSECSAQDGVCSICLKKTYKKELLNISEKKCNCG